MAKKKLSSVSSPIKFKHLIGRIFTQIAKIINTVHAG